MIETSSVPPRKSSEIFGKSPKNVRKRSPYLRNNFGKSSEIFGKWSEIFGKSSKTSSLVCLCNKQNITCPLVDMRERVRCRVEHEKIKFISTRGHVISSISAIRNGYKIPFISTPPPRRFTNNASALKEADFVNAAILELLHDNRVEEIISPPDIVNPLSVSVQPNGKKRLILDLRTTLICMSTNKNLSARICIPLKTLLQKTFLFSLLI